jgi:hypothetical protein
VAAADLLRGLERFPFEVVEAMSKPDLILASASFMAAYEAELTRHEWLDRGANWRRAKREANKVLRRKVSMKHSASEASHH